LALKTLEELKSGQIWIHFQPFAYLTPTGLERINPRPPMPRWLRRGSMCRAYFAGMPSRGKAWCEAIVPTHKNSGSSTNQ
jgi:hypothetical protein